MVVLGSAANDGGSRFSWIEYQALMLCLAGVIFTALSLVEVALNRFQVLPLLFPGMFTVRERRFFFFNFDISDGVIGKRVRAESKMVVRITICLVLSYLWQHCVLETTQQVGNEFPRKACEQGADCFASTLDFATLYSREYESLDCQNVQDFKERMVVSCIRFVPPTATTYLMHLAISHSITQLNFKAFELLVWICGNSKWSRRIVGSLIFLSLASFVILFFGGLMSEFVSSWLSFVMSLSIPLFLYSVFKASQRLEHLWKQQAIKVQLQIETHLSGAFADIETAVNLDASHPAAQTATERPSARSKESSGRVMSTLNRFWSSFPLKRVSKDAKKKASENSPEQKDLIVTESSQNDGASDPKAGDKNSD